MCEVGIYAVLCATNQSSSAKEAVFVKHDPGYALFLATSSCSEALEPKNATSEGYRII